MSFLSPWMLLALPLAAIPIVIHLFNQRRYQTTQWAAMMFLLAANRMTRGYARLRQWLILAMRTLVIAALVFAIGRPLADGAINRGLLGSIMGQTTANTIVLLDRSPSMQARDGGSSLSKLETGVAKITETLRTLGATRLTLIESNTMKPQPIESPDDLAELPQTGPSDASADVPAMMTAALDFIDANELGQTDVWVCSDLREGDWRPEDGRWASLRESYAQLGRRVRFRLLTFASDAPANRSVRVDDASFDPGAADGYVSISLTVQTPSAKSGSSDDAAVVVPVTIDLNGARSIVDVTVEGGVGSLKKHLIAVPKLQSRGYGRVSIPKDSSPADDDYFFTYDVAPPRKTVIVTEDADVGRVLKLAAEISPDDGAETVAEIIAPAAFKSIDDDVSLLLWHTALIDPAPIEAFVARGGCVMFFPDDSLGDGTLIQGLRYESWREPREPVQIVSWRGDADLLANTMAGAALPVGALRIERFVGLVGEATPLATLSGGDVLLARGIPLKDSVAGVVYVCTTSPTAPSSSLATDGVVLYVMVQRALETGVKSQQKTGGMVAGSPSVDVAANWTRLEGREKRLSTEAAFTSGVYSDDAEAMTARSSASLAAVSLWAINRGATEDRNAVVAGSQVDQLFSGLVMERVSGEVGEAGSLVEEIWRVFLTTMIIAMIVEACLCLPRKPTPAVAESGFRMAA